MRASVATALVFCASVVAACGALLDLQPLEVIDDTGEGGTSSGEGGSSSGEGGPSPCGDVSKDPKNCGRCGHECPGSCSDGTCTPVLFAASPDPIGTLAQTSTDIYFLTLPELTTKGGTIRRCAKTGCNTNPSIVVNSPYRPTALAVDEQTIMYAIFPVTNAVGYFCPTPSCSSATMLPSSSPFAFVPLGSGVVWSDTTDAKIYGCAKTSCGTPNILEDTAASSRQFRATRDGKQVVYLDFAPPRVRRRDETTAAVTIATPSPGYDRLDDVQLTPTDAIYTEAIFGQTTGGIRARKIDGSEATSRSLVTDLPTAIATDDDRVYYDFGDTGAVLACRVADCKPETVATGLDAPSFLVADARWVWVATKKGIFQLAKP